LKEAQAYFERRIAEKEDWEKKIATFETIINMLNKMGREKEVSEALVYSLQTTHRTLQANFCRMIKEASVKYAEFHMPERTDARNEEAVRFAKAVSEIDIHIPFI